MKLIVDASSKENYSLTMNKNKKNEYLFFSLIQLYGTDKAKKKEVYHHILDKLGTNNEYNDICQKLVF